MTFKMTIAYDGTDYHGWQIQPNGVSFQSLIEDALHTITQEKIKIVGAGRTDAGVHALGQVAHFHSSKELSLPRLQHSLNGILPKAIRILNLEEVDDSFHAQYSAISKIYRYHLYLKKEMNPFKRLYVWHIPYTFDEQKLHTASRFFLGTHDFTSFANEAHAGVAAHDPVRNLSRIDIVPEEGGLYIEFEGDGFLYKMVRNIVGVLVECATGKRAPEEIPSILAAKDRRKAGLAAPPQGLFLVSIKYPNRSL